MSHRRAHERSGLGTPAITALGRQPQRFRRPHGPRVRNAQPRRLASVATGLDGGCRENRQRALRRCWVGKRRFRPARRPPPFGGGEAVAVQLQKVVGCGDEPPFRPAGRSPTALKPSDLAVELTQTIHATPLASDLPLLFAIGWLAGFADARAGRAGRSGGARAASPSASGGWRRIAVAEERAAASHAAWSRPVTPSAGDSNATCMTGPSPALWRSRSRTRPSLVPTAAPQGRQANEQDLHGLGSRNNACLGRTVPVLTTRDLGDPAAVLSEARAADDGRSRPGTTTKVQ